MTSDELLLRELAADIWRIAQQRGNVSASLLRAKLVTVSTKMKKPVVNHEEDELVLVYYEEKTTHE